MPLYATPPCPPPPPLLLPPRLDSLPCWAVSYVSVAAPFVFPPPCVVLFLLLDVLPLGSLVWLCLYCRFGCPNPAPGAHARSLSPPGPLVVCFVLVVAPCFPLPVMCCGIMPVWQLYPALSYIDKIYIITIMELD